MSRRTAVLLCALLLPLPAAAQVRSARGVIVTRLEPAGEARRIGIEIGDVLHEWRRTGCRWGGSGDGSGWLDSPFDLALLERTAGPGVRTELEGQRGSARLAFELEAGSWGFSVAPSRGTAMSRRLEGSADDPQGLLELAHRAERADDLGAAAWLAFRAARIWKEQRQWQQADASFDLAERLAARGGGSALDLIRLRRLDAWLTRNLDRRVAESATAMARSQLGTRSEGPLEVEALEVLGFLGWRGSRFDAGKIWLSQALAITGRRAPASLVQASVLAELAKLEWKRRDLEASRVLVLHELAIRRALAPAAERTADAMLVLGLLEFDLGRLDVAGELYRQTLAIYDALGLGGVSRAIVVFDLALVHLFQGDLDEAERLLREAYRVIEQRAPGTTQLGYVVNALGILEMERGDLVAAERHLRRAVAIREQATPGDLTVAESLSNLAILLVRRGDLAGSEQLQRRALAMFQEHASGSILEATTLCDLGDVLSDRLELEAAERSYARGIALLERESPEGLDMAISMAAFGSVAGRRGDLAAAELRLRKALDLMRRVAPANPAVATTLQSLAGVAAERGDTERASALLEEALAFSDRVAPGGLRSAAILHALGVVALDDPARLERARKHLAQALEIRQRFAPGSAAVAVTLHALGRDARSAGRSEQALDYLLRAVAALEVQKGKLGGTEEARGQFAAAHVDMYRDLVELLLELGHEERAFHALERSRAQRLRAMLAERELVFGAELPSALERRRRIANVGYDRIQDELLTLAPLNERERLDSLLARRDELRREQAAIQAEIRRTAPRLDALQAPASWTAVQVRDHLDPGTLLLGYSLAEGHGRVFALGSNGLSVARLEAGSDELARLVAGLRTVIVARGDARARLNRLGDLLLRPVADEAADTARLLVIPDGPLHGVPWAALSWPTSDESPVERLVVEARPVHVGVSGTVYGQLLAERRERRRRQLVGFGDPHYPGGASAGPSETGIVLRSLAARGFELTPLPGSRAEVEAIGELFEGRSQVWLGSDATEERAKTPGSAASLVHFACHAVVDERFPLDSALALSIPEEDGHDRDNGLLQAWEVFESVRLDADLVTLSACETALGQELAGEGIVGLTRAFQYAGARTVLASLWSVADESTAELMRRFYANLEHGMAKDQALRHAQQDFIRGPVAVAKDEESAPRDLSHPFFWAAFQLHGDWN